jgi:hypothetical protein
MEKVAKRYGVLGHRHAHSDWPEADEIFFHSNPDFAR